MKNIKKLDFFSHNIPIFYHKDDKYNTNFGCFFSFAVMVIGVISLIYFSQDLIFKTNPKTIESNFVNNNLDNFNLRKNNIFFTVSLWSKKYGAQYINESVFSLEAYIFTRNYTEDGYKIVRTPIKFEKCSQNNIPNDPNLKDYFKTKEINDIFCLNKDFQKNLSVFGEVDDLYYQAIIINLIRCKENSNNSSKKCASKEEMNEIFSINYLYFNYFYYKIDPTNYKNPKYFFVKSISSYFTINDMKKIYADLKNDELITDKGYLLTDEKYEKVGSFGQIDENIYNYNPKNDKYFAQIYLRYSKNTKKIKRSYDKITKVLAEVGGMLNIIFITTNILIKPVTDLLFAVEIINKYFYIKLDESEKGKIENKKKENNNKKLKKNTTDGTINQIELIDYPISMFKNCQKNSLSKVKTNFFKLISIMYFQKKFKKKKDEIINLTQEKFLKKCDIVSLLKCNFELDIIKNLLFDEDQLKLLKFLPKFIVAPPLEKKRQINFEEILNTLKKKSKKTEIDKKLLDIFLNNEIIR